MKALWCLLLAAPLATGCLELPKLGGNAKPAAEMGRKAAAATMVAGVTPAAPRKVTPDQVTDGNAYAMAEALDEEIARDEQAPIPAAPGSAPAPKKR